MNSLEYKKIALLIGVSEYGADIPPLSSALNDVAAMERVLQNPNLGNFTQVERLLNPDTVVMRMAIQKLFRNASQEDLLLLFFSGHGITNDDNHLYLATRNTSKEDFEATAVDANFIQTQSNYCYSKRQVLILDACYSGAFANGWHKKSVGVDIKKQLGAEGRVVLTSSSATQTSFAQEGATLSLYTQYLVEGIETGAADTDNDGNIHVQELHAYAKTKVQAVKPNMTPDIILDKEGYNILLAYAPRNPETEYRKLVEQYAQNGQLKNVAILVLTAKRKTLGITDTKAEEIETEVLEPFRRRLANLQNYKQHFAEEVEQKYPLDAHTLKILKDYQQDVLGLRDEDVESIELEITSVKEAEYQKQLQIQKQREVEALQRQREAQAAEQLRLQQEAEVLQRQRDAKAAKQLRLQEKAEVLQQLRYIRYKTGMGCSEGFQEAKRSLKRTNRQRKN
ncbi:caspase domain-containing protein [Anabaena sp. PCC 7108]|uniref:caspase family protein n=1 Tax=Anabaena sp. PCC 7108 TaxID=163908 RepID=UPI00034D9640|nr:caspase family protein [Anabaena sp. PCC 7108]